LANIEERSYIEPLTAFIGDFFIHHTWSICLRHYDPVLYSAELEKYLEIITAPIMHAVNSKTSVVQYPYNETILEKAEVFTYPSKNPDLDFFLANRISRSVFWAPHTLYSRHIIPTTSPVLPFLYVLFLLGRALVF
jgi:hypothetical protein